MRFEKQDTIQLEIVQGPTQRQTPTAVERGDGQQLANEDLFQRSIW